MLGPGRGGRFLVAGLFSAAVNAAIIVSLSATQGQAPDAEPPPSTPVTVRRPPPPPPPPPTPPPEAKPMQAQATPTPRPLPRLELPAVSGSSDPLALPRGTGDDFGWDIPVEVPTFAAGEAALEKAAQVGFEPAQAQYHPDLTSFYPRSALRLGTRGRTLLLLDVDARGRVTGAKVLESDPPGVFERAALRAAKRFRFRPAQRGGRPQASTKRVELEWRTKR